MASLSARCQSCLEALQETERLLERYSDLDHDLAVADPVEPEIDLAEARENLTALFAVLSGANALLARFLGHHERQAP